MLPTIGGIHHVTAICGPPRQNLDFYGGVLGLRLVKLTVNYDDPETYHLYYGDGLGTPGTLLTFFAWESAPRGRQGNGQAAVVSLAIPQASLGYWIGRLIEARVPYEGPRQRWGEQVLSLRDPDGLALELVAVADAPPAQPWPGGPPPGEHAVRGLHSVTLWQEGYEHTAQLLTELLGFGKEREGESLFRYRIGAGGPGALVELRCAPGFWPGAVARGTVHHVALRTADDASQELWRQTLAARGYNVSPILDRTYFRSIYFREPGGVLFEIATDSPGFAVDEPAEQLGAHLQLPPWLEGQRDQIEQTLPPLR